VSVKEPPKPRTTAARLAVRRGEFVQWRRRILAQPWLWIAVFVVAATLLVTPTRGRSYPVLAAGDVAPSDIVVHREITIPDTDSTEQKRRRAALEVLPVYDLDNEAAATLTTKLAHMFEEGRRDLRESDAELAQHLTGVAGVIVQPREAAALRKARFSNDLLGVLDDIVTKVYRQGVVADRAQLLQSGDKGVVLRSSDHGAERVELDVYRFLDEGSGLAEAVEQRLSGDNTVARSWRAPLTAFLTRAISPNVVLDKGETLARRMKAAAGVEEVLVRLPRGRVLVRRGDEVTPQTARLLAALAARTGASTSLLPWLGTMLVSLLLAGTWFLFLRRDTPAADEARIRFGGVVILTVLVLFLERGFAFLAGGVAASLMRDPFGHVEVYLPALPHAAGPVLAGLMYGLPVAMVFAVVQTVLVSLMLGGDVSVAVYTLIASLAAAFASQRLKERNVLARVAVVVAGVNALAVVSLAFFHGTPGDTMVLASEAVSGALGGVVAAALASFLLPVLESLTGTVTDIRLLELSNPNLPLLKRLSIEAPGTFQHSVAMANLSEAAAEAIGANPLLARVCCYYHDIGKLAKPEYFVENQRGSNPHDHLTPWMSALVVSNHVKAGLELARQYKLPEPIREAITTHHGNKLIRYFYSRAKEQENPDRGEVSDTDFRYPGPKPHSKEMGIIHLADAVEAASRTVQDPAPGRLQGMIDQIVKHALEDGQLDECDLTLKDVEKIGAAFFWVLTNAFHHRIDYPGFDFNRQRRGQ
jgi:putative nucleotidyltransferase with HDIG domain